MQRDPQIGAARLDGCEPQRRRAWPAGRETRRLDPMADHRRGELVAAGACAGPGQDDASLAQHGDTIGDRGDFAELVADEDDGQALRDEAAQRREQALGLGRRQDSGRLVEDQQPDVAVERLQDLDALLLADAEPADRCIRVDRKP
jgi:hypothetical protein